MMSTWNRDMDVPAIALPATTENLEMGATSISFKNPNSLSQTIDMAENMDANRMVNPNIPGKRNWV